MAFIEQLKAIAAVAIALQNRIQPPYAIFEASIHI